MCAAVYDNTIARIGTRSLAQSCDLSYYRKDLWILVKGNTLTSDAYLNDFVGILTAAWFVLFSIHWLLSSVCLKDLKIHYIIPISEHSCRRNMLKPWQCYWSGHSFDHGLHVV